MRLESSYVPELLKSPGANLELSLDGEIYESASQANERNQSIAHPLQSDGRIYSHRRKLSTSTPGSARWERR
jgi:glutaminase